MQYYEKEQIKSTSVQERVSDSEIKITVHTKVKTSIKISANNPNMVVVDRKIKLIKEIEVGITSQNLLKTQETQV